MKDTPLASISHTLRALPDDQPLLDDSLLDTLDAILGEELQEVVALFCGKLPGMVVRLLLCLGSGDPVSLRHPAHSPCPPARYTARPACPPVRGRSEVTEGLTPTCPTIFDIEANTTREEDTCVQRLGVVRGTHCDAKNQVGLGGVVC